MSQEQPPIRSRRELRQARDERLDTPGDRASRREAEITGRSRRVADAPVDSVRADSVPVTLCPLARNGLPRSVPGTVPRCAPSRNSPRRKASSPAEDRPRGASCGCCSWRPKPPRPPPPTDRPRLAADPGHPGGFARPGEGRRREGRGRRRAARRGRQPRRPRPPPRRRLPRPTAPGRAGRRPRA